MRKLSVFSLIELSIVILVVGILIAGVTSGSRLVSEFQLQTARTLTNSSSVSGIKDLMLWYETSLESSFDSSERTNQSAVSTWYDINPQSSYKNNATKTTTASKPLFIEGGFPNNITAVRFDGTNDRVFFDGTFLVNTSYTILT
ncbi:MAG: type II secretion system protein [Pelagibacterales bacterium]|nr:type II secretion system protein [Pelagibacterales bacterium]